MKIKGRIHILNAHDKDSKEIRFEKIKDKIIPPSRWTKIKRALREFNKPIEYPKL